MATRGFSRSPFPQECFHPQFFLKGQDVFRVFLRIFWPYSKFQPWSMSCSVTWLYQVECQCLVVSGVFVFSKRVESWFAYLLISERWHACIWFGGKSPVSSVAMLRQMITEYRIRKGVNPPSRSNRMHIEKDEWLNRIAGLFEAGPRVTVLHRLGMFFFGFAELSLIRSCLSWTRSDSIARRVSQMLSIWYDMIRYGARAMI